MLVAEHENTTESDNNEDEYSINVDHYKPPVLLDDQVDRQA